MVQDKEELLFNVKSVRVFEYSPDDINSQSDQLVEVICNGSRSGDCDSPILNTTDVVWKKREEIDNLHNQIELLTQQVSTLSASETEQWIAKSNALESSDEKISVLEEALIRLPGSPRILLELGILNRLAKNYTRAIEYLELAVEHSPDSSKCLRELGITYSKEGRADEGIVTLEKASKIDPNDAEIWSNLGGAFRRKATDKPDPVNWNDSLLLRARECYCRAHELNQFDLYPGLNIARIGVTLARNDPGQFEEVRKQFATQSHLANYLVDRDPEDYWTRFDLADCQVFSGQIDKAKEQMQQALMLVPQAARLGVAATVLRQLEIFLMIDIPDMETLRHIKDLVAIVKTIDS